MNKPIPSDTEPADPLPPRPPRLSLWGMLGAACALIAGGSLFAFAGRWWWTFDVLSHFRVQYLLGFTVAVAIFGIGRRWRWAIISGLFAILNALLVVPLYIGTYPMVAEGRATYRLLVANVYTDNEEPERLIALIRAEDPDLILLMEVNEAWMQVLRGLEESYPVRLAQPEEDNFGILLLSRLPLLEGGIEEIGMVKVASIVARLQTASGPLTIVGTHPLPPAGRQYTELRDEQLARLAERVQSIEGPLLLAGDLNTTSWSHVFADLVRQSGLRDSRAGFGVHATWPTMNILFRITLDHVLVSPDIAVQARRVGPAIGSDHFPVILDFAMP